MCLKSEHLVHLPWTFMKILRPKSTIVTENDQLFQKSMSEMSVNYAHLFKDIFSITHTSQRSQNRIIQKNKLLPVATINSYYARSLVLGNWSRKNWNPNSWVILGFQNVFCFCPKCLDERSTLPRLWQIWIEIENQL